jgi:GDPmannose 4,6-dehydratase
MLVGDATKARRELEWAPRTSFRNLVGGMVRADLEITKQQQGR